MNKIEVDFLLPHPIHSTGKAFSRFRKCLPAWYVLKVSKHFSNQLYPPKGVYESRTRRGPFEHPIYNKAPEGKYESTPVWGPIDFLFKFLSIPSVNEK